MAVYSFKGLCDAAGASYRTAYRWRTQGVMPRFGAAGDGQRAWGEDDLVRLRLAVAMKKRGLYPDHIRSALRGRGPVEIAAMLAVELPSPAPPALPPPPAPPTPSMPPAPPLVTVPIAAVDWAHVELRPGLELRFRRDAGAEVERDVAALVAAYRRGM